MINPVQLNITKPDNTDRKIIIEPILEKDENGVLKNIGLYKLYKDGFGDETILFTEPREAEELNDDLSDDNNPDYLGKIIIINSVEWLYEGDLLSYEEQLQVIKQIRES